MWVKYKTITNKTFFDNSLPLDDEMELRGDGVSSNKEIGINEHFIKPGARLVSYNGPYSLFVCASCFISCSVHAQFASVTLINCKWRWGCRHF